MYFLVKWRHLVKISFDIIEPTLLHVSLSIAAHFPQSLLSFLSFEISLGSFHFSSFVSSHMKPYQVYSKPYMNDMIKLHSFHIPQLNFSWPTQLQWLSPAMSQVHLALSMWTLLFLTFAMRRAANVLPLFPMNICKWGINKMWL